MSTHEKFAKVFQYATIVVSSVGIVSNFLALRVFHTSSKFRKLPFTIFFKILIISDTIILLHSYLMFSNFVLGKNLELVSISACKLVEYTLYVFDSISTWVFGLILVERLVAITLPSRRHWLASKRNQIVLLATIALFSSLIYLSIPFFRTLKFSLPISNSTANLTSIITCAYSDRTHALIVYVSDFVNITLSTLVFNNTVTVVTLVCIFKSRKRASALNNSQQQQQQQQQAQHHQRRKACAVRDRKFAINSIIMDFVFFGCELPVISIQVVANYVNDQSNMLFSIGFFVFALKCSSCFWINLCVNSIFRNEFLRLYNTTSRLWGKYQKDNSLEMTTSKAP